MFLKQPGFSPLSIYRWLFPLFSALVLAGYFGPWVDHQVAGLVVTGVDLGELVKFLPAARSGAVTVWREGFYLPLVAVSLILSLTAFRRSFSYGWPVRGALLAGAAVAALNLLPPAWTPTRLMTPEFRLQTAAIGLCLTAIGFSPLLALLKRWLWLGLCAALCLPAIWFPVRNFLRVLPGIAELYNKPLQPGWGVYALVSGLLLLPMLCSLAAWSEPDGQLYADEHR